MSGNEGQLRHYPGCEWFCGPTHAAHLVEQRVRCMCDEPRKRGGRCTKCRALLPETTTERKGT